MRLERLPIFIDLYETRSYTKTAQKNYVSQASVTQLVNSLEEEFGVKLFDRSTLPIQATAAGKQLYHDAKILLRQYIQLKEVLPRLEQEGANQIRLCYTSQIDLQILLPFVRQFKAAHPAVAFQVELCPFRDASQMLWAGKCDGAIGIDFEPEFTQGMETLVLYEGEYQALVPQGHPPVPAGSPIPGGAVPVSPGDAVAGSPGPLLRRDDTPRPAGRLLPPHPADGQRFGIGAVRHAHGKPHWLCTGQLLPRGVPRPSAAHPH